MGIIKRNSFNNTIISFAGAGLGFLSTIWLFPNLLTQEQNGLTVVLVSIGMIYYSFAHLGSINAINHFYFRFHESRIKTGTLLGYCLLLSLIGFTIIAGLILAFRESVLLFFSHGKNSELLVQYMWWLFPISFSILFFALFEAYARSLFKLIIPVFLREILIRVLNIISVLLFWKGWIDFQAFVSLFVGAYFLVLILMIGFLIYRKRFIINFRFRELKRQEYVKINRYSIISILNSTTWVLASRIDVMMLAYFIGLKAPAVYNVAMALVVLIQIPLRSMQLVSVPVITRSWKENDIAQIQRFYHESALNLLIIGSFLFLMLVANFTPVFHFLPSAYRAAKPLIIILGISKVIDMGTGVNTEIIMFSRKYYVLTIIIAILMFITLAANFILIPKYGVIGAAYSSFIAYGIFNLMKFAWVKREYGLSMTSPRYWGALLLATITFCAVYFIPDSMSVLLNSLEKSLVVLILFLAPVLLFKLSPELNNILQVIRRRSKKLMSR